MVGAYCIVKRKKATQASSTYVKLGEYNTGKSVWREKPETMIKKVAEAQALRGAFTELAGTYDESERWEDNKKKAEPKEAEVVDEKESNLEQTIKYLEGLKWDALGKPEVDGIIEKLKTSPKLTEDERKEAIEFVDISRKDDLDNLGEEPF